MTLNQIVLRVKNICLAHKQVRNFYRGLLQDFMQSRDTEFASAFMQEAGGSINISGKASTFSFRLFFMDLVHVSEDAKDNELEVQSDMVSIAMDIIAQLSNPNYDDWAISTDNQLQLLTENDNVLAAGCYVDISIRIRFTQNICQVPTEIVDYIPTDTDMKIVYDEIYIATGDEDKTLTIPILSGKRVLLVVRENNLLYKVSNLPGSTNYTWDLTDIGLGTSTTAGERFLILYRTL